MPTPSMSARKTSRSPTQLTDQYWAVLSANSRTNSPLPSASTQILPAVPPR
ncbi:hypothetical protein WBK31_04040 [Nonomuraea sp. N2-4H]|uniref:hypothetical protein n=1 Tax=Nonomuraea sp. N2-4H TaxID=3128898 RepID=UPI003247DEA6